MKNRTTMIVAISISVMATLILALGAFAGGLLLAPRINGQAQAANIQPADAPAVAAPLAQSDIDIIAAYERSLINLYKETLPSVVNIRVTQDVHQGILDRFDFGDPEEGEEENEIPPEFFNQGGGSGFVWDTEGHIITNHHVVRNATEIEVIFADDTAVEAQVVGSDPDADIAVIKIDLPSSELAPVKLGDSDALEVGQLSVAVGNPFGQDFTMTTGIVSAIGRTIRSGNGPFSIPEVIQTDAPINPGNSGGPLFNRQGEVIGINTQIISRSGGSSGIGFAVPINIAKRVVPTLIEGDTVQYAWLGISGNTLSRDAVEFRNLDLDTKGAVVLNVVEDGPAQKAGLQGLDDSLDTDSDEFRFGGDIITAINGETVSDMDDLISFLANKAQPGDVVTLDVIHVDGTAEQIEVTLDVRPSADTFNNVNE